MKIELTALEQLTLITTLKRDAKRLVESGIAGEGYFADKVELQKDLYKRIAGYDMDIPVLLEEL